MPSATSGRTKRIAFPKVQMAPNLQRIWPRTQFPSIDSTCVPYSFVPTPMKPCFVECRMKWKVLLSTLVTGLDEWRCRRMGEPPGQMLDWMRKSESIRGDAGGRPGHQETAGNIGWWLARQMRWERHRARDSGDASE